jgi:hypothetical protein
MKVAVDKAVATKPAKEAVVKASVDVAAMKTADQGATAMKTIVGSVGSGSGSSPAPAVGSKRATALIISTPPSKRFCHAWKPQYAEQLCSHLLLFFYLY